MRSGIEGERNLLLRFFSSTPYPCFEWDSAEQEQEGERALVYFIKNSIILIFSEQQIVDCSGNWGNYGCGGGSLRGSLRYLESVGAMSYNDYPYEARVNDFLYIIFVLN